MNSDTEILPDYDLTCWYLNIRRVLELIGIDSIAYDLRGLEALSQLGDATRQISLIVTLKNRLTEWLHNHNPPTLGQLLIEDRLKPGMLFTHYDRYFCKGLSQVSAALRKGRTPPAAEAYAKLDTFEEGLILSVRFHHDHLTSNSAWTELSGQRRLMVLGAATEIGGGRIEAIPWVMADPLPDLFGPHSIIANHWSNRLEVHLDSIDSFALVRDVPPVRSKKELAKLRDIPEREIKEAFAEIIAENSVNPDWGGEQSDLFSAQVRIDGRRISTAFAFKGPAKFHPMTMADLGKNGDQINRLFAEPAELLILQHCHEITPPVRGTMRAFAQQMGNPRIFCLIDGYDTIRLLQAYGKCGFQAEAKEAR
ncbi:hypothetical protein [Microvirga brassicacearum]|uniref:Uncharacterized protein n=1 Tax=Microvirga brassicacearum TaxID=2580413 RepID=A0A5N3PFI4_9HYPH|nr:hypothetical protein [Microvirga brassicacearum]KAB0268471.1 hypothetical protein FEZ63_05620 [Microvirga brassicacearum]